MQSLTFSVHNNIEVRRRLQCHTKKLQCFADDKQTFVMCCVLMTNEMHNSYNQFYSTVFVCLHISNESSRSSSGARHNILHYTIWYNRAGESTCFKAARLTCTIVLILL